MVVHQPSKLTTRVRFPSPAHDGPGFFAKALFIEGGELLLPSKIFSLCGILYGLW